MTQPKNSYSTNFGRFYAHPKFALERLQRSALDGALQLDPSDLYGPKPSVTNITGMLDKKFLPPFYAKLVAEYAIEHHDSIGYLIKRFGPQVAIGTLKAIVNQRHKNADIGNEVHAWIDAVIKNEPDVPLTTSTAVNMASQFTYFLEQAKPEIIHSEFTVWSYEHGYAGTGDAMWRLWGDLWLVDYKTGNSIHPEVALQTTALAHADVILDADGNESPMPLADIQGVVHVRPRSVKLHKLERTDEAFETFLALKRAFDWVRFDAEHVIQEPYKTERLKVAV